MKDDDGRVTIDRFYDGIAPLSDTERRAIASHAPEDVDTEPPDANGFPQGIPPVTPEPAPTQP